MHRINKYEVELEKTGNMNVPATIYICNNMGVESGALEQLKNAASLPGIIRALATPDIHQGYGVPIGSVLGCSEIVVPAAVGYDINCGMRLHTTPFHKKDFPVNELAHSIRRDIPLGEGHTNVSLGRDQFELVLQGGVPALLEIAASPSHKHRVWDAFNPDEEKRTLSNIEDSGSLNGELSFIGAHAVNRGKDQLATLGGGNHFIEIQYVETVYDEELARSWGLIKDHIALMIHSGSRGLGHQIGGDYMKQAAFYNDRNKDYRPARDLSYFHRHDAEARQYLGAMRAAANFAYVNRALMSVLVKHEVRMLVGEVELPLLYDVPHNIAKEETHFNRPVVVHRKGATRAFGPRRMAGTQFARTGQPVLIPGSMGTASYVLVGVDENTESLASVNHGAGRVMSRTAAAGKRKGRRDTGKEAAISDHEFQQAMKGITLICEDPRSIKEEAPQAYKDIDAVIECVVGARLARSVARMRPLAVLKG